MGKIDFSLDIEGFQTIFCGGVAVYVKDHIAATQRHYLEINSIEALWLELRCVNKKCLLCNCYRPPNAPVAFWNNYITYQLQLNKQEKEM